MIHVFECKELPFIENYQNTIKVYLSIYRVQFMYQYVHKL